MAKGKRFLLNFKTAGTICQLSLVENWEPIGSRQQSLASLANSHMSSSPKPRHKRDDVNRHCGTARLGGRDLMGTLLSKRSALRLERALIATWPTGPADQRTQLHHRLVESTWANPVNCVGQLSPNQVAPCPSVDLGAQTLESSKDPDNISIDGSNASIETDA
jgi:hypothetical protein